jgi:hypothetical protein
LSLVSVVCCQVEVCASGWSLVQRSPTECGVSVCDREASIMGGPWPTGGLLRHRKKILYGRTVEFGAGVLLCSRQDQWREEERKNKIGNLVIV